MQMNFLNTPIDCESGNELYLLVCSGKTGIWYSPVKFVDLKIDTKQARWGHGFYFDVDYYTLIMSYTEKSKNKEIKVKWRYSKKEKPNYKKSKNFISFNNIDVTCTPIIDGDNVKNVYITKNKDKIIEYINKNNIFDNAIKEYNKMKQNINFHCDEQINRILGYKKL